MTATKAHADASPSSSAIWTNCPASVTKARGRVRKATVYTTEGTVAHLVAELMLKGQDVPVTFMYDGQMIAVTEEMLDAVEMYVDYVKALPGKKQYETRVHVDVQGEPLYGTADAIAYDRPRLEVVDLKYGAGVAVDPDSSQLKIYMLGALEEIGPFDPVEEVTMTIVQPRGGGIKSLTLPIEVLADWEQNVLIPAVARLAADDKTETPGDHCRWCVRAGECQSLAALAMKQAKVLFDDVNGPSIPTDAQDWTNEELAEVLNHGEMIVAWVNKVRAEVSGRIDNGQEVPGWKMVPKRASRKWDDPDGALLELDARGVPVGKVTRIETIGNVEKALKRMKLDPEEVIYPYTIKESSGTTLVSEKDGRPAVDTSSKSLFSDVSAFETDLLH